jgi:DNA-directed RNA polymerase subunit RPC12/RpoP
MRNKPNTSTLISSVMTKSCVVSQVLEMLSEEYPAPVCDDCSSPMWVRKRLLGAECAHEEVRFGFECHYCHSTLIVRPRVVRPSTDSTPPNIRGLRSPK